MVNKANLITTKLKGKIEKEDKRRKQIIHMAHSSLSLKNYSSIDVPLPERVKSIGELDNGEPKNNYLNNFNGMHLLTATDKMIIVRSGISKRDFEKFKKKSALDYDMLAQALSVTRATLINKKGEEKFNTKVSEAIVSLTDIYAYGYEVFDDNDHFNSWMLRSNKALGGQAPFEFLDNQFGRKEVMNVIGRIDYGVYS